MSTIKCIFFLAFVALASGVPEHHNTSPDPWGKVREPCRRELNISPEQLRGRKKNIAQVGDYLLCTAAKLGHLKPDRTLRRDTLARDVNKTLPPMMVEKVLDCTFKRVYESKQFAHLSPGQKIAEFTFYAEKLFSEPIFNIIGVFEKPSFDLPNCPKY